MAGRKGGRSRAIQICVLIHVACAAGMAVLIDNVHPRLDTNGNIVDAHDGSLLLDPQSGRFWLYGTHCKQYQDVGSAPPSV